MKELGKVIEKGEKILWEGKPEFWPYIFYASALGTVIILSIITLIIVIAAIGLYALVIPFLMGLFLFGISVIILLYNILQFKNIYYAVTNKRVILQVGVIGRDFKYIDFDQITNVEVNVGIVDKLFNQNTGTILISTAGSFANVYNPATHGFSMMHAPYLIASIKDPYKVFTSFKKVSHDVKTDIHFPNRYRPKSNQGYKTRYAKPKGV